VKVALVVSAYEPAVGGVEHHVRRLATGLAAGGDDVTVVTHRLDGRTPAVERKDGVAVHRFPLVVSAPNYRFSPALGRYLRDTHRRFDVVHVHSYHTLVGVNALMAGADGMVFTPHYHGTGHTRFRALLHRPYRSVGRRVMGACRFVVCVSAAEAELLSGDFPAVADRVVVIPNGTDRRRPSASALASCAARPGDVVSVGRLEHYKRNDLLIEAMASVPAPARLVIVGDGPARDDLRRRAQRLGLADRVVLTGRLPDDAVAAVLDTAGVLASFSEHEAFGLSVADGLVAGARVVASDVPAHREVASLSGALASAPATGTSAGGTGAAASIDLVRPGDARALAAALTKALAAGRPDRPAPLPTWEDVVSRTRSLYAEAGAR
jgi:glycosyltransferase involved in cell wall biosynthesis